MDSWEWNKIIGAILGTALVIMVIGIVTDAVYHVEEPKKQAYVVEGVTVEQPLDGAAEPRDGKAAEGDELPDFGTVLAAADLAAGERIAQRCTQCHTWDKGGANRIGPNLFGIVGAKRAHLDSFNYSAAMRNAGGTWTYEELYRYLESPARYMPGNKMAFAGIKRSQDRVNLIAFMRTWGDNPLPLPAPRTATAPAAGSEPEADASADEAPSAESESAPAEPQ